MGGDVADVADSAEDLGQIVVEAQDGRKWKGKYRSGLKPPRWNKA